MQKRAICPTFQQLHHKNFLLNVLQFSRSKVISNDNAFGAN